jgi:hypothetical protein
VFGLEKVRNVLGLEKAPAERAALAAPERNVFVLKRVMLVDEKLEEFRGVKLLGAAVVLTLDRVLTFVWKFRFPFQTL